MKLSLIVRFLFAVPIIESIGSACLFFIQGGFGGGHGTIDFWIGVLGLPTSAVLEWMPIPKFILDHDFLLVVVFPGLCNLVLVLTLFGIYHLVARTWWGGKR